MIPNVTALALMLVLVSCKSGTSPRHQSLTAVQGDSSRPPVPPLPNLPADSTFTVEKPGTPRSELLYYRNIVGIIFDDTASGATVRRTLARHRATITGGSPSVAEYLVRIPDPGPSFASLDSVVTRIYSEPGVALARKVYYRTPFSLRHGQGRITVRVSGRVMSTDDRWPVYRATVGILGASLDAQTDSTGAFRIPTQLGAGCHRLRVRALGYGWTEVHFATTSDSVNVNLGDVPLRAIPVPEWPLLLVNGCDAGPLAHDDAPWGVDTVTPR